MMRLRDMILILFLLVAVLTQSNGFTCGNRCVEQRRQNANVSLRMGLFDGIAKAFSNEDFKSQDQRVRASHILIKGDDIDVVFDKVKGLMGELNIRVDEDPTNLQPIFSELARRESQCPSAAQGGDLGMFGPGKMVKDFDLVLFPEENEPPAGSVIGPVVTEFGCHIILVTQREENKDQVEEKLARIDPDARKAL